jgi:hypothetical protein
MNKLSVLMILVLSSLFIISFVNNEDNVEDGIKKFYTKEGHEQVVTFKDGIISKIDFFKKPPNKVGTYMLSQEISFNDLGFIDSLFYFHGYKEKVLEDSTIGCYYQRSYLYLDSLGNIKDCKLMTNNFELVFDFKKQKSCKKRK